MFRDTLPKHSLRRSFRDGSFFFWDGRKDLILGYNLQTRRFSCSPGELVKIHRLTCQVLLRPVMDLDKTAWELGLYRGQREGDRDTFQKRALADSYKSGRHGVERPMARLKYGKGCGVALCQERGPRWGWVVCWYADPDCDPAELEGLMKH